MVIIVPLFVFGPVVIVSVMPPERPGSKNLQVKVAAMLSSGNDEPFLFTVCLWEDASRSVETPREDCMFFLEGKWTKAADGYIAQAMRFYSIPDFPPVPLRFIGTAEFNSRLPNDALGLTAQCYACSIKSEVKITSNYVEQQYGKFVEKLKPKRIVSVTGTLTQCNHAHLELDHCDFSFLSEGGSDPLKTPKYEGSPGMVGIYWKSPGTPDSVKPKGNTSATQRKKLEELTHEIVEPVQPKPSQTYAAKSNFIIHFYL